jgi:hypothetical protein
MEQKPAEQAEQKTKSNTKVVLIIVAVVLVVLIVGGYMAMRFIRTKVSQTIGQKIGENMLEKAIEQGTGNKVDVNADGENVKIKTKEGGEVAVSGEGTIKLPSDFPSDVFVYSDAKITYASSSPANSAEGTSASYMVAYSVNQSVDEVASKYKDEMVKNGWTKESEANYGALMISFKKDGRDALVTISTNQESNNGTTGVSVTGS